MYVILIIHTRVYQNVNISFIEYSEDYLYVTHKNMNITTRYQYLGDSLNLEKRLEFLSKEDQDQTLRYQMSNVNFSKT